MRLQETFTAVCVLALVNAPPGPAQDRIAGHGKPSHDIRKGGS
jgi:hypothetical protein